MIRKTQFKLPSETETKTLWKCQIRENRGFQMLDKHSFNTSGTYNRGKDEWFDWAAVIVKGK